jgi:hypothetical protein
VDRYDALAPALGFAYAYQAPVEVYVLAVQIEQFRAALAAVGEQREQQAVALDLPGVQAIPDSFLAGHVQQA